MSKQETHFLYLPLLNFAKSNYQLFSEFMTI